MQKNGDFLGKNSGKLEMREVLRKFRIFYKFMGKLRRGPVTGSLRSPEKLGRRYAPPSVVGRRFAPPR